jgi:CubicO group peptidase (beta-lactamase class C family)
MLKLHKLARFFSVFALCTILLAAPLLNSVAAHSAQATAPIVTSDTAAALATIEKAIDQKRQELGIPGLSLVIVKDDQVIYMKGLGVKDFEKKLPVTTDTLFAIGSASKAFTSMIAVMSADEHKLSLEDSPKKFLPYFKLRDSDADTKITIRDLLSHRSGLNRTDIAMVTGVLNRAELIEVAAMAKPTAKLGEKFQYQNVMYAAAGEAVAQAQHSTWDKLIATKIFKPLGMRSSNTTVPAMQKSRDYSFGYEYNPTTKQTRRLPQREIDAAAPAGAINSSARDMAQWVRFMLAGGVINGKRLVSEQGFNQVVSKQMNVGGTVDYGLGWFLRQWNNHKVVEHGGNIDGFNSQVAMMPDQKLGFVLLTNVTASTLGSFAMNTIWKNLVGEPAGSEPKVASESADPKIEVGKYHLAQANVDFEVTIKDDKLMLTVPGQPTYPLQSLGGRRYKLAEPAPPGFFATFRPVKDKEGQTELFLEQPQGNVLLLKDSGSSAATPNATTADVGALSAVVGSYESESSKQVIEIGVREGKVSLVVPGQQPYPLEEKEKDKLRSPGLPPAYWVEVNRDNAGTISGIVINQPEGRFTFRRLTSASAGTGANLLSTDELLTKMIAAYGGEENLLKHKSSVTTVTVDMENQGVQAYGQISARAPNQTASDMTLTALGKKIGSIVSYFDGTGGGELVSFGPEDVYSGKRLQDVKAGADFYDVLNWKKNYKSIVVKRIAKIGDEDAYVVEKKSEQGTPVTDYVSTKTFLVLQRDSVIANETAGIELPQREVFSDYRQVDGVMIPFKMVANNIANGDIVLLVKDVKWNVEIPDAAFHKPVKSQARSK